MISRRTIQLLLLTLAVSSLEGLLSSASSPLRKPNSLSSSIAKEDDSGRFLQSEAPTEEEVEEAAEEEPEEPEPDTSTTTTTEADDEADEADEDDESEDGADEGPRSSSSRSGGVAAPTERECTNKQTKDEVEFECKSKTENTASEIKDKLEFKIAATKGDFLKIKVEYSTETETDTMETESETQYTLVYDRLIEYRKVGSAAVDAHYEWGVDEVVAEWSMDTWDSLSPLQDDGNLLKFSATDGIATFSFTIAQTDSADITTNKMKIDFLLENYPWDAMGDTYVALVSHVETEQKTETDIDGQDDDIVSEVLIDFEQAAGTVGFVPFGEYTWASTAEASRTVANVTEVDEVVSVERMGEDPDSMRMITSTIEVVASYSPNPRTAEAGTTFNEIAFSFVGDAQGADRIFWDPEAGVGYTASSAARWIERSFVALLTVGATLGVVFSL